MSDIFPAGPSVYYLPPGADFPAAFARGLAERLAAHGPLAMPQATVVANARRTARAIEAALEAQGDAVWLPRFGLIANAGTAATPAGMAPAADPLRRRLALLRLVEALLERAPDFGPLSAAPALAQSLGALMDDLYGSGRTPEDLRAADLGDHAKHWERTRQFLQILTAIWPHWLAQEGVSEPQARRLAGAEGLEAHLAAHPPAGALIGACSTGSTPATAAALAAIARARNGAVVLPGFDPDAPADVIEALSAGERRAPEHPQAALHALLAIIGIDPDDVQPWTEAAPPSPPRLRLLTESLRPAPVTDRWRAAAPALAALAPEAAEGMTLLEAANEREEAAAIALLLAEAARGEGTAALITPDRNLSRRVTAELRRWGVLPDDSAGQPLALTPPGLLLGLIADGMGRPMTAPRLFAILRHPLTGGDGPRRRNHLRALRMLERAALRGGAPEIPWDRLAPAIEEEQTRRARQIRERRGMDEDARAARLARIGDETRACLRWLFAVRDAVEELASPPAGLGPAVALHLRAAEILSGALPGTAEGEGLDDAPALLEDSDEAPAAPETPDLLPIWRKAAGEDALAFMTDLLAAAPAHDEATHAPERPPAAYAALFHGLIGERDARPEAVRPHDRIQILGTLEARAARPDLAILGGLAEGIWPAKPEADPWAPRDLRAQLGLPSPEVRTGLAAHDYLLAANAPRVVLSRSRRRDGAPSVASRWLIRLENLLTGVDEDQIKAMRARGESILTRARALDHRDPVAPADRPAPVPPVSARPRELPVTAIETLIRDPYAVYARYVLNLRRLDPIGRAPDARDMGNALHAVMERFAELAAGLGPDPAPLRAAMLAAAEEVLPDLSPSPALARFWRMRLHRAADWFAAEEADRRGYAPTLIPETKGRRGIHAPGGDFILTARADRIDRRPDGTLALYDYKSGGPPSKSEQKAFAKQLALSAAVARAGGFRAAGKGEIAEAVYLGLTGDAGAGGKSVPAPTAPDELDEEWAHLRELIAAYDAPDQPYPARLRPKHIKYDGDYDHLSRHGEWGEGAGEDGE